MRPHPLVVVSPVNRVSARRRAADRPEQECLEFYIYFFPRVGKHRERKNVEHFTSGNVKYFRLTGIDVIRV